jgi:hypothetical protein
VRVHPAILVDTRWLLVLSNEREQGVDDLKWRYSTSEVRIMIICCSIILSGLRSCRCREEMLFERNKRWRDRTQRKDSWLDKISVMVQLNRDESSYVKSDRNILQLFKPGDRREASIVPEVAL